MKLIVYCSWFRPTLGRDCGEMLLQGLERRGHELSAVIGYHKDEDWQALCHRHGWNYIPTLNEFSWPGAKWSKALQDDPAAAQKLDDWLKVLAELKPDLGFSFFATWIPPALARLPRMGFVNFHPAPLPQLRSYFPEDLAILKKMKSCGGTLHRVDEGIDEGSVIAYTRKAKLDRWDTPDSLMQKISEAALPDLWAAVDRLEKGRFRAIPQDPSQVFEASYEALYRESFVNWTQDDHEALHRKFQVFRGQAHRMVLKADWEGNRWVIWDWELHKGAFQGKPGELLGRFPVPGSLGIEASALRTTEGLCLVWHCEPYAKEEGSTDFVDQKRMHPEQVMAPGVRYNQAAKKLLARWKA